MFIGKENQDEYSIDKIILQVSLLNSKQNAQGLVPEHCSVC